MLRRIKDNQARRDCRNTGAASSNSAWGMGGYAKYINCLVVFGCNQARRQKTHMNVCWHVSSRLSIGTKCEASSQRHAPATFTSRKKPWYQLNMTGVTQSLDRRCEEAKKLMTLSGIDPDPSVVQPVASSLHRLSYPGSVYLKLSSVRITCTDPNP